MSAQYVVATQLDGSLDITAIGPFRKLSIAEAVAEGIEREHSHGGDGFTVIAQVVPLRSRTYIPRGHRNDPQ